MNVYGMLCINYALIFYLNYQVTYPRAKRAYKVYLCRNIFKQRNPNLCLLFFLTNQTVLSTGLAEEVLIYTQNPARWELFLQSLWFLTYGVFT